MIRGSAGDDLPSAPSFAWRRQVERRQALYRRELVGLLVGGLTFGGLVLAYVELALNAFDPAPGWWQPLGILDWTLGFYGAVLTLAIALQVVAFTINATPPGETPTVEAAARVAVTLRVASCGRWLGVVTGVIWVVSLADVRGIGSIVRLAGHGVLVIAAAVLLVDVTLAPGAWSEGASGWSRRKYRARLRIARSLVPPRGIWVWLRDWLVIAVLLGLCDVMSSWGVPATWKILVSLSVFELLVSALVMVAMALALATTLLRESAGMAGAGLLVVLAALMACTVSASWVAANEVVRGIVGIVTHLALLVGLAFVGTRPVRAGRGSHMRAWTDGWLGLIHRYLDYLERQEIR